MTPLPQYGVALTSDPSIKLQTSRYMMMVSMAALHDTHNGFQISKTFRCFWHTWYGNHQFRPLLEKITCRLHRNTAYSIKLSLQYLKEAMFSVMNVCVNRIAVFFFLARKVMCNNPKLLLYKRNKV
jgi:hypothetical protein